MPPSIIGTAWRFGAAEQRGTPGGISWERGSPAIHRLGTSFRVVFQVLGGCSIEYTSGVAQGQTLHYHVFPLHERVGSIYSWNLVSSDHTRISSFLGTRFEDCPPPPISLSKFILWASLFSLSISTSPSTAMFRLTYIANNVPSPFSSSASRAVRGTRLIYPIDNRLHPSWGKSSGPREEIEMKVPNFNSFHFYPPPASFNFTDNLQHNRNYVHYVYRMFAVNDFTV